MALDDGGLGTVSIQEIRDRVASRTREQIQNDLRVFAKLYIEARINENREVECGTRHAPNVVCPWCRFSFEKEETMRRAADLLASSVAAAPTPGAADEMFIQTGAITKREPFDGDMFDASGDYPSDEALEWLRTWPLENGLREGLEFAASLWHWPDGVSRTLKPEEATVAHADEGDEFIRFATGGWSGNEDIIGAIERNLMLRSRWRLTSCGGLHIYELPPLPHVAGGAASQGTEKG